MPVCCFTCCTCRRMHACLLKLFRAGHLSFSQEDGTLCSLSPARLFHIVYRGNMLLNSLFLERDNSTKLADGTWSYVWVSTLRCSLGIPRSLNSIIFHWYTGSCLGPCRIWADSTGQDVTVQCSSWVVYVLVPKRHLQLGSDVKKKFSGMMWHMFPA